MVFAWILFVLGFFIQKAIVVDGSGIAKYNFQCNLYIYDLGLKLVSKI